MATATVSYRAELKDLRAKLESATDITRVQARKMVSELSKSMKEAERSHARVVKQLERVRQAQIAATKASTASTAVSASASKSARDFAASIDVAAQSTGRMGQGLSSVAMQIPDVVSQISAGTPPLQAFAQQGLQVVQVNMSSLMATAARLGPLLAGAAVPVAALGAAYLVLSHNLKEAEERMAEAARTASMVQAAYDNFNGTIEAVNVEFERTIGVYDELGAAQEQRDRAIKRGAEQQRKATEALYNQAVEQRRNARTIEETIAAEARLSRAQEIRDAAMVGIAQREQEALTRSAQITEYTNERAESEETLRQRVESRNAAARKSAETERELLRLEKERAAALQALTGIQETASMAVLDGEARLAAEYRKQMEAINALEATSQDASAARAARASVQEQYDYELWQTRMERARQEAAEQKRLDEEVTQQRLQHERRIDAARQQSTQNWLQATQVATAALAASFEQGSAAATAFYMVSQSVAAAQAIIQGFAASMAALAPPPLGLGPVAGAPLAASMKALGIAQAGAIMATTVKSFSDTPGIQRAGPGGMSAMFSPGDLVVAGRDDSDLVRQMQRAGIGMGGGAQVMVRDADRHRGRYGRDPMRAPDRYQTIRRRAGRIPGRR